MDDRMIGSAQRLRDLFRTSPSLRPFRHFARRLMRYTWTALRAVGLNIDPDRFFPHPVDRKIGHHLSRRDEGGRLLAVYDLAILPLSFDIVFFLANAVNRRRMAGCRWLDVAFVAHHSDPLQDGRDPSHPVTAENHQTFVHGMGIEATRLFDNVGDVLFFADRREFARHWALAHKKHQIFPDGYSPFHPDTCIPADRPPPYGLIQLAQGDASADQVYSLRPPEEYLATARSWLDLNTGGKRVVTVTLRKTPFQPRRNSNIPEWQKLVDHYKDQEVCFIVLRDFFAREDESTLTGPNVTEYPEAVLNLPLRAAIYQEADLNLFVNNGPAGLCYLNHRSRYLVFKMTTGDPSAREEDIVRQHVVQEGQSPWGAMPFQKWVWEPDNFDVMRREMDAMLARIAAENPTSATA